MSNDCRTASIASLVSSRTAALLALMGVAASARAQGSDDCASASPIAGIGTFSVSNVSATNGGPDGIGCVDTQLDVWFRWTSTFSGTAIIESYGGVSADSVLTVWSNPGSCPTTVLACNDDSCGLQSRVTFPVSSGSSYFVQWGAFGASTTYSGTFSISSAAPPPANDDCASPIAISGSGSFPFDNGAATTGAQGQSEAACLFFGQIGIAKDCWWTWTADASGTATFSTCGTTTPVNGDTKVAIYDGGGCPVASAIACNEDDAACGGGGFNSTVSWPAVSGQTYTIQLGQFPTGSFNVSGTFAITQSGGGPSQFAAGFESSGTSGDVHNVVVFNDGTGDRLYAAGSFDAAGTAEAGSIAAWNGTTWASLSSGVDGRVFAMAAFDEDAGGPQPARLFVAGAFTKAGGIPALNIARWNGSNWSAVGAGTNDSIAALRVFDHDGPGPQPPALYVGGLFDQAGGLPANSVARWTGAAWQPLSSGMDGPVVCFAPFDADGNGPALAQLHAGGFFEKVGGLIANGLARWNGSSWQTVGGGVTGSLSRPSVHALSAFDEDGAGVAPERLFVGGSFSHAGGAPASSIARWNGSSFSSVGGGITAPGSFPTVRALAVFDEGSGPRLYAAGLFRTAGSASAGSDPLDPTPLLIAASWNGSTWSALGSGLGANTDSIGRSLTFFDDDGNGSSTVLVAGQFSSIGTGAAAGVARWTGATWVPLGTGRGLNASAHAFVSSGATGAPLYVGGSFKTAGPVRANHVARWNDASSTWSALGLGLDGPVRALELVGADLYAGGDFEKSGATPRSHIARYDGASWQALGSGTNGTVHALKNFGGTLIVGGEFATAGGVSVDNLAAWTGASWSALSTGTDDAVRALEVFDDGSGLQLYVAGSFERAGGVVASGIARWNGAAFAPLGSGLCCGGVYDLAVFDAGSGPNLYAAGQFEITGDQRVDGVARWNGSSWQAIGSGFSGGQPTRVLALSTWLGGGPPRLAIGGDFATAGGTNARNLALWDGATWSALGAGADDSVQALWGLNTAGGQPLFVGGNFVRMDQRASAHIARTN